MSERVTRGREIQPESVRPGDRVRFRLDDGAPMTTTVIERPTREDDGTVTLTDGRDSYGFRSGETVTLIFCGENKHAVRFNRDETSALLGALNTAHRNANALLARADGPTVYGPPRMAIEDALWQRTETVVAFLSDEHVGAIRYAVDHLIGSTSLMTDEYESLGSALAAITAATES